MSSESPIFLTAGYATPDLTLNGSWPTIPEDQLKSPHGRMFNSGIDEATMVKAAQTQATTKAFATRGTPAAVKLICDKTNFPALLELGLKSYSNEGILRFEKITSFAELAERNLVVLDPNKLTEEILRQLNCQVGLGQIRDQEEPIKPNNFRQRINTLLGLPKGLTPDFLPHPGFDFNYKPVP